MEFGNGICCSAGRSGGCAEVNDAKRDVASFEMEFGSDCSGGERKVADSGRRLTLGAARSLRG